MRASQSESEPRPRLHLRDDERDERFSHWFHAQIEAFECERSKQNEAVRIATENHCRGSTVSEKDFSRSHRPRLNDAGRVLDLARFVRRDADLFEEPAWDLGEIGSRVNESFQLELATGITWIPNGEFNVKGSHRHFS